VGGCEENAPRENEVRIVILRSAIEDLARGRDFYEKQGEGLGDYFEEALAADIESLHLHAGIHVMTHGYHRMLSGKFPYAVYYESAADQIRIRAVLNCRRDPRRTRSRLRD
jgi:plasmid stabilization system protein ParE